MGRVSASCSNCFGGPSHSTTFIIDQKGLVAKRRMYKIKVSSREETLSRYKSKLIACSPVGRSYSHVVSLIKAPNLGNTFVDSLNKIFKQNKENIHPE